MKQINISVDVGRSKKVADIDLIVSVRSIGNKSPKELVVGYPGLPNVIKRVGVGDAVLFESPGNGIIEVRVLSVSGGFFTDTFNLLISQVSPRFGILAGPVGDDPNNLPFTREEVVQIADSVSKAKFILSQRNDLASEQFELIARKLDEIQVASERLGRKDWINYVAGTTTSLCISAAFSPEVTKAFFQTINTAFAWLFANGLLLING